MSSQPATPATADFKEILRQGWRDSELSVQELWFRYRTAGGKYGHPAVRAWLMEASLPAVDQYVILAQVMNERIAELGKPDRLVPSIYMSYLLSKAA